jgi:hypothetical protein
MNQEYKSREIAFFKNGKFLFLGEEMTPKIVEALTKIKILEKQRRAGMLIETVTVFCFVLSFLLMWY